MRLNFSKAIALSLWLLVASTSASANMIGNGSFESPETTTDPASGTFGLWKVYSSLTGWETPINYIELQRNGLYGTDPSAQAPDGVQWAELDSVGNVQLRQKVQTEAGSLYSLSFFYSERPDYGMQQLAVYWNNTLVSVVGSDLQVSTSGLNWRKYTFDLVGTGSEGVLAFGSLANFADKLGAGGNLLDNVILTKTSGAEVPEPTSLLLLTAGGAIVASRRRKLLTAK